MRVFDDDTLQLLGTLTALEHPARAWLSVGDGGEWLCSCGNDAGLQGFAGYENGRDVIYDDDFDTSKPRLWVCYSCFCIFDETTLLCVGRTSRDMLANPDQGQLGEDYECLCGNTSASSGFEPYFCGRCVHPVKESGWNGSTVACLECGRIIDGASGEILTRKTILLTADDIVVAFP